VAPAGWNRPFPEENARLFERVVERGGAYLSLVEDETSAFPGTFFPRNACLAALAHLLVVAETPYRSGARNAGRMGKEARPPAIRGAPPARGRRSGQGCLPELRAGAQPFERVEALLKLLEQAGLRGLSLEPLPGAMPTQQPLPLASEGAAPPDPVLRAIQQGCTHADEVAALTGLSPAAVQQRILTLALSGVLVPDPWGCLKLITP
jgi:predicted Rossmann fold nucleotide-binding protein DprA/Smf involved in DNA uptake